MNIIILLLSSPPREFLPAQCCLRPFHHPTPPPPPQPPSSSLPRSRSHSYSYSSYSTIRVRNHHRLGFASYRRTYDSDSRPRRLSPPPPRSTHPPSTNVAPRLGPIERMTSGRSTRGASSSPVVVDADADADADEKIDSISLTRNDEGKMTTTTKTTEGETASTTTSTIGDDSIIVAEEGGGNESESAAIRRKRKNSASSPSLPPPPPPPPAAAAPASASASASAASATESSSDDVDASSTAPSSSSSAPSAAKTTTSTKKTKASTHQQWTERTPLIRLWDPTSTSTSTSSSTTFTIISWNVAGLRALIRNRPDALPELARKYDVDVLCLQETKLQVENMDDPKLKLREYFDDRMGEYDRHWSYSIDRRGYSGTAMFIRRRGGMDGVIGGGGGGSKERKKKKQATLGAFFASSVVPDDGGEGKMGGGGGGGKDDGTSTSHDARDDDSLSRLLRPTSVVTELGLPKHDGEGRTITAEFPLFYLTNVYVPNSGQKLDRLAYRTEEWDSDFVTRMKRLEDDGKRPVIWLGDLNVAHGAKDTWNEGARHLAKSAGTTAEERASFDAQLGAGYVDAFRRLHPDARGHYTYWSQRAGNREPNRGLRLDYFVCSGSLMEDDRDGTKRALVRDSYMLPDESGSDHCPIVLLNWVSSKLRLDKSAQSKQKLGATQFY
ncbi:hypothetical protein ACHAXA_000893 [Cyclostephanos tholiformis]|uniref:DNA-(apurinic or apyrimidinic site) endonuclease n=1 Tax=Cyclostephanos tholiformis TaxID=382380 RepID=A0ABD3RH73_9STRA